MIYHRYGGYPTEHGSHGSANIANSQSGIVHEFYHSPGTRVRLASLRQAHFSVAHLAFHKRTVASYGSGQGRELAVTHTVDISRLREVL